MTIILNEKLRELRREHDMTQSELAEKLGVTVQAVSKWERAETFPDITLLPMIATIFDVTIDALMGMEETRVRSKLDAYYEESKGYLNRGEIDKDIALWEKAHEEFPSDLDVTINLMHALFMEADNELRDRRRIIALGESIWDHPKLGNRRDSVAQTLTFAYDQIGDKENAKKYAATMGSMWTCSDEMLVSVLDGEEACQKAQQNIVDHLELIRMNLGAMCHSVDYPPESRIRVWKSCIRIFEAVFEDGDFGFSASRMASMYRELGASYARLFDAEQALDALEKRAKYTVEYDTKGKYSHTSPMINRLTYDPSQTTKNYPHNMSYEMLKGLQNQIYDFIREAPRFLKIEEELRKIAK